jgi:hypothetical protein
MLSEPILQRIHPGAREAYDFQQATYTKSQVPITGIICPIHGEFRQYIGQLRKEQGAWCPMCGATRRAEKKVVQFATYVDRATATHAGKYTYEEAGYVDVRGKVQVVCPIHGGFTMSATKHLYAKQGCPACGAMARGHRKDIAGSSKKSAASKIAAAAAGFEAKAVAVHKGKYSYEHVKYVNARTPVHVVCAQHGTFQVNVYKHLAGQGCPSCARIISVGESQVMQLVRGLGFNAQRTRTIIPPKELDIYAPEANLAIEYCGEYWHSSGSPEEELKARWRHHEKYVACQEQGVRLITMFETEWLSRNYAIRRLLRNALGKSRGKLMARKCELRVVPHTEARVFYDKYHPQGGSGNGVHYALLWQGKIVACMRFNYGANDRGVGAQGRTWTLARYATRVTVAGGASRLFQAFVREHQPTEVKSFSDNRFFGGQMYVQLGFQMEEESMPDYQVWHPKLGLRPKTHYQRRKIPSVIRELGLDMQFDPDPKVDPRPEREMTFLLGARRIYDCGKKRWVWTPGGGGAIMRQPGNTLSAADRPG